MNKNQIKGSSKELAGKIRETAGKAVGSKKMQRQGNTKRVVGKAQKAVGNLQAKIRQGKDR